MDIFDERQDGRTFEDNSSPCQNVTWNLELHRFPIKFTFSEKATKIDKIFTVNLTVHCKCLQGFTGGLQGNLRTGISNLRGLHVTCNPCNLFQGKTVISVGNMIYRDATRIPRINCKEKNVSTMG